MSEGRIGGPIGGRESGRRRLDWAALDAGLLLAAFLAGVAFALLVLGCGR
jgi:hypothetical protein